MRIPSGTTDQFIYFTAVDSADFVTRETGLSSFTVYRSRNGAAAAAMTTPTINETDATNMPGVYELLLDEDMTIGSGNDTEEIAFHITHAGMAPVTRAIELYRPKITVGETLTVASGVGSANATQISGDATAADNAESFFDGTGYAGTNNVIPTVTTLTGHTAQTGDSFAYLGTNLGELGANATEAGGTGDHLTAINLPDQTMNITGNITGNVSGSVGSVTGNVGGIAGTIQSLDALDTAQDAQHSTTQSAISTAQSDLDIITGTNGVLVDDDAITAAKIAADAIGASELAADAVTEIQSGLATSSGLATAQSDLDTITGADGVTLATVQGNYAPSVAGDEMDLVDAPNATAVAAIQSGLSTYDGSDTSGTTTLLSRLTATRAGYLDNLSAGAVATASALASLAGKFTGITSVAEWLGLIAGKQVGDATARTEIRATGAGSGTFDETTDSIEAIRDRGDASWITGGGGGITQSLNVQPVLPTSIDLANTSTVRMGLILVNALDDLPSTAEIAPGTISIDRKAIGGTSWSAVVTDAAMSEQAGMVYYDEVFDSGTGYAEGDSIRVTFKSISVTADTNTHEVCDANGVIFQTEIRQTMRGTDSAYTGTPPTAAAINAAVEAGQVGTDAAAAVADLANATDGLGALKTLVDAVQASINNLNDPTAVAIATAVCDRVVSKANHNISRSLGRYIREIHQSVGSAVEGVVDNSLADATTTSFKTDLTAVDDFYNGQLLVFTTGALAGQARPILDYAQTNGVITLDEALTSTPADAVEFAITPVHVHAVSEIVEQVLTKDTTSYTTANTLGAIVNDLEDGGRTDLLIDELTTQGDTNETKIDTVDTVVDGIQADLSNATDGLGALKTLIDAVQTAVDAQNDLSAAEVNAEVDAALADYDAPTKAELDVGLAELNDLDAAGIRTAIGLAAANLDTQLGKADLTAALTEAYRSTGATGSAAQLLYEILAHLGEFAITSTTKTTKKLDGSTTAKTYTLDSDTSPTSITEAT